MNNLERMQKIEIEYSNFQMHPNDQNARDLICALKETLDTPPAQDKGSFVPQDMGIVKAVHEHYGQWPSPRLLGLAQAIEAEIEDVRQGRKLYTPELEPKISQLEADSKRHETNQIGFEKECIDFQHQIEGVRKLFRNHEERLKDQEYSMNVRKADAHATRGRTKDLEHKVKQLQDEQNEQREKILEHHDKLMASKPPPPQAFAKDEEGKKHPLKPGVSVCVQGLYLGLRESGMPVFYNENRSGQMGESLWTAYTSTWLRDLDFPPFAKAQDVGGDK